MSRATVSHRNQMRQRIAQAAARIIAEDGVADFSTAKRKAARQLAAPDSRNLPTNAEIIEELKAYQSLYQAEEQPAHLRDLRRIAIEAMTFLNDFEPRLTGSVLTGTATLHSNINLQIFPENPKELELFLLNHRVAFRCSERRFRQAGGQTVIAPTYTMHFQEVPVEISVLPPMWLRQAPRSSMDARPMERAKLAQVVALMEDEATST